jgi:hypothetical protein
MNTGRQNRLLQLATFFLATSLFLAPGTVNAGQSAQGFDTILKLGGITFHVTCANQGSLNDVTIVPSGLQEDNRPITIKEADGTVTGAEIADLNRDGSPEIFVFITSAGSGSYGSLIAYSANNNKSLSQIYLPPLADDKVNSKGYMGHDTFAIKDSHLVRSFPLYKDMDTNAQPTGGMRQLEYTLVPGEATWQLKLVKSFLQ